ncbi:MAG TPA: glycosyltransferase [Ktedonobacteraceae bacterium]
MKIALVAPLVSTIAQPFIGGAQALLADLAHGLQQRGHAVTLFARAGSSIPGVPIESIAVPEHVRPATFAEPVNAGSADAGFFTQANLFLELFLQLQRRAAEFDLIHAHAFDWPAYTLSTLARPLPILHTLHLPAVSPEINEALRVLDRQGHPLTLITVSQSCAQTYAPFTPVDHVIYNGLDIRAIPFQPAVAPDAPLLFAGRVTPEKGVETALEIAELANRPLLIAGGIYDQHYYEQRVKPRLARPGARVNYIGQVAREQLWQLMGQAAALLCPIAWDESFGLTPVEAMATGTPVIAFQRGAMSEIIQHSQSGFLVPPGAISQAAALVEHLPAISRAHCRAHVAAHFTLETMLDQHEQVYQEVTQGRRGQGS